VGEATLLESNCHVGPSNARSSTTKSKIPTDISSIYKKTLKITSSGNIYIDSSRKWETKQCLARESFTVQPSLKGSGKRHKERKRGTATGRELKTKGKRKKLIIFGGLVTVGNLRQGRKLIRSSTKKPTIHIKPSERSLA